MTDTTATLENLHEAASTEHAAVRRYLLDVLTDESWGLDKLATKMRPEMLEEPGHAG